MQFINYFFALVISYFGLLIGILLISIAPEEQKPLGKYFALLRRIFLFLIFIFVIFYYFNRLFYFAMTIFIFIILLVIEFKTKDLMRKSIINYVIFAIIFFLSSRNPSLFAIESSLILLYGIPTSSLLYNKRERNYSKVLSSNILFVVIANILFLL